MAKPDAKKFPKLKEYWDSYGHMIPFEKLTDCKMRSDACYIVVCWEEENGMIGMADMARGDPDFDWDMQNDGFELITPQDWKKLKIVPDCDWFVIPGNDNFRGLS